MSEMTKMSNICFSLLVSVSKQRYQFTTFHPHYQAFTLFIVQNRAGRGTDDFESDYRLSGLTCCRVPAPLHMPACR